jgi:Cys-rich repeat protein
MFRAVIGAMPSMSSMPRWIAFLLVLLALGGCSDHTAGKSTALDGDCRSSVDCSGAPITCVAPGTPYSCVACAVAAPGCGSDSECPSGQVCSYTSCCGDTQCSAPCLDDASCGEGQTCDTGGHCHVNVCVGAANCPSGFDCNNGSCERRGCQTDADCAPNFCVQGACFSTLGHCGSD